MPSGPGLPDCSGWMPAFLSCLFPDHHPACSVPGRWFRLPLCCTTHCCIYTHTPHHSKHLAIHHHSPLPPHTIPPFLCSSVPPPTHTRDFTPHLAICTQTHTWMQAQPPLHTTTAYYSGTALGPPHWATHTLPHSPPHTAVPTHYVGFPSTHTCKLQCHTPILIHHTHTHFC